VNKVTYRKDTGGNKKDNRCNPISQSLGRKGTGSGKLLPEE
jgi:hypothetical protein